MLWKRKRINLFVCIASFGGLVLTFLLTNNAPKIQKTLLRRGIVTISVSISKASLVIDMGTEENNQTTLFLCWYDSCYTTSAG